MIHIASIQRDLLALLDALRLDQAHRCGGPLRLTALPTGARISGCEVRVANFPAGLGAMLTIAGAGARHMTITLEYAEGIVGSRTEGNRMVGDRPAHLDPQLGQLELLGVPKGHLIATFAWPSRGFSEADAVTVLGGRGSPPT
ncbi:hypothetical protein ACFY2R_14990 [Micromonospora olivasterospora]|uniref:Uncharacterized protein n=1 Tax=Micromonospora olivasterospora TaxID=1880 RepID=A0A562I6B8_MICOL|nr:hypothetical protein [Micromonospora olivasterospora]TWH66245.1 hypothetical protein JD77_01196 [Micromonospora olivasterospora]